MNKVFENVFEYLGFNHSHSMKGLKICFISLCSRHSKRAWLLLMDNWRNGEL